MAEFVFPIEGTCGACCLGNVRYWITQHTTPKSFQFKKIELMNTYKDLIVEVSEDVSEDEVRLYLSEALADSGVFKLAPKIRPSLYRRWMFACLGLGVGAGVLLTSLVFGPLSLPLMIVLAVVSVTLSVALGAESYRKARTDLHRRTPKMDSLFAISTATALLVSIAALFVPGLPMMFEVPLLIFGFRHLGIAIKESMPENAEFQARYRQLVSSATFQKKTEQNFTDCNYNDLRPGDVIALRAGDMIPMDGWLWEQSDETPTSAVVLDVSRVEGALLHRSCADDDPVMAGMVALTPCLMRIGLGQAVQFCSVKPNTSGVSEPLRVYAEDEHVMVSVWSSIMSKRIDFKLSSSDLTDIRGIQYASTIRDALRWDTTKHLSLAARQQLARAILNHAHEHGLITTSSYLEQLDKDLKHSALTKAPIWQQTDRMLQYFVPGVIAVAMLTGLVLAVFFPPMIAVQAVITILVSACPCTLGLIIPLVMDLGREKGKLEGIEFSHSGVIEALSKTTAVVFDLHGTLTQGKSTLDIQYHDGVLDKHQVMRYLAELERGSSHPMGLAIFSKIEGNALLAQSSLPWQSEDVLHERDGVRAYISGKHYLLGNGDMLQRFGIDLPNRQPGTTYFVVQEGSAYQRLATITNDDPLRADAAQALFEFKQRQIPVYWSTGGDKLTADFYAKQAGMEASHIFSGLSGIEHADKKSKVSVVRALKEQGHNVLMIGDGVNDVLAMEASDVSMVMTHAFGDKGAQYKAQVRIMNGQVMSAVKARDIAEQAMKNMRENLWGSLVYNVVVVSLTLIGLLAFGVVLHPGIGAALMVLQICFIILHAYGFKQQPLPKSTFLETQGIFASSTKTSYETARSLDRDGQMSVLSVRRSPESTLHC